MFQNMDNSSEIVDIIKNIGIDLESFPYSYMINHTNMKTISFFPLNKLVTECVIKIMIDANSGQIYNNLEKVHNIVYQNENSLTTMIDPANWRNNVSDIVAITIKDVSCATILYFKNKDDAVFFKLTQK